MTTITEIDRTVLLALNGSDYPILNAMVQILTNAYTWVPLYVFLIFLVIRNNEKWSQIVLIITAAICCVTLSSVLSELICKPWVARLRPFQDANVKDMLDLVDGYTATGFSFFSSHAANTFSLAVFMSLLVRRRTFTVAMVTWSLVNCWTRLYLGVHYPSDVLVGILWGGIVGVVVYIAYMHFYLKVSPKLHFISTQYTSTGYSLTDIDIVLNVMTLMLGIIIVAAIILSNT